MWNTSLMRHRRHWSSWAAACTSTRTPLLMRPTSRQHSGWDRCSTLRSCPRHPLVTSWRRTGRRPKVQGMTPMSSPRPATSPLLSLVFRRRPPWRLPGRRRRPCRSPLKPLLRWWSCWTDFVDKTTMTLPPWRHCRRPTWCQQLLWQGCRPTLCWNRYQLL